jgi:hypothetical protein
MKLLGMAPISNWVIDRISSVSFRFERRSSVFEVPRISYITCMWYQYYDALRSFSVEVGFLHTARLDNYISVCCFNRANKVDLRAVHYDLWLKDCVLGLICSSSSLS